MRVKTILKHVFEVTTSNITTIISGIIVGFILPKIISVNGFGLYKTFTLYVTYLGLFSLGIIDGIVLDYGGVDYDDINRPLFRCYFRWYFLVHIFFVIILLFGTFFAKNADYRFIIFTLSINLLAVNLSGYFQNLSQITQRFKEYSTRKILQSVCIIIVIIGMLLVYRKIGEIDYKVYVVALVVINTILTLWYIYTYRELVFGKADSLMSHKKDIVHLIKIGFPLLFANLCSTLILTLDRQFVNFLFDQKTYAIYAFAYSMLALVTVATSAIATVLYPTLKRTSSQTMQQTYPALVIILMVFVFFVEIIYYPLKWFILWFLPKYSDSLVIFRIIFPGLGISSIVTVIIHNYYKAIGKNLEYFKKSIITILFSVIANMIAYMIFRSTVSISIASIITMIMWYIYLESYFRKKYDYDWKKIFGYLLVMIITFYLSTSIHVDIMGLFCYLIIYLFMTYIFFKNNVHSIIIVLKK